MAAPLPRPSISGLQAALSSCRISTAAASKKPSTSPTIRTTASSSPWRAFSTTPSTWQTIAVPPHSPKYISLPEPPLSSEPRLPPLKGHLPVPRDIFPRRDGDRKVQPAYLAAATRPSKAELAGEPPRTEHEAARRRMAAARRGALAAGIRGLHARKTQFRRRVQAADDARRAANLAAATAPEPLDEVLTRPTVRAATAADVAVRPAPDRFAAAERAAGRQARRMALKAEARRDALAQLYVAAKDFIVDEAELEARIEATFTPASHGYGGIVRVQGQSIWDVEKRPISVSELRAEMTGSSINAILSRISEVTKTTMRQKTVSEELTGGKL